MEIKDFFRILIVDDSTAMRFHLREIIKQNNITPMVFEAKNGKEAFLNCPTLKPDLVIMDIRMPQMNGIEAIKKLHALDPTMKIMAVTGSTAKEDTADAIKAGASEVIIKPFNQNEMAFRIVKNLREKIKADRIRLRKLEEKLKVNYNGVQNLGLAEVKYLTELRKKSVGKI